jgi:Cu/Ag efflux pump CusA
MGVPELRHSLAAIRALRIDTPSGSQVTLGELADVRLVAAPTEIERSGISRYVDVVADVAGRDIGAVQGEVTAAIRGLAFPLEYHAEVATDQADRTAGLIRVLAVVIAVVVAVFLVLQAATRSWRLAIVSMVVLALALAGGLVSAFIAGGGLTLGALAGAFAVVAIAARSLLALLARLPEADHVVDVDGVVRGATERLRPILMTVLTMSLALAPILVLGERPGLELLRPTAVVIIGGLVTTAFLMLFVVPTIYVWMYGSRSPAATIEPPIPASPDTQPAGAS